MIFQKIVVVVNKKIPTGVAMNSIAHVMLGFSSGMVSKDQIKLNKYHDFDGNIHDNISELPIVILRANCNQIRSLRKDCINNKISFIDFTESMTIGTYEEEYELTKTLKEDQLNYYSIVLAGDLKIVSELTRKFSLYI